MPTNYPLKGQITSWKIITQPNLSIAILNLMPSKRGIMLFEMPTIVLHLLRCPYMLRIQAQLVRFH
jgi:hypothetical protein